MFFNYNSQPKIDKNQTKSQQNIKFLFLLSPKDYLQIFTKIGIIINSVTLNKNAFFNSKITFLNKLHDNLVEFIEGHLNFLFACKPKQPV